MEASQHALQIYDICPSKFGLSTRVPAIFERLWQKEHRAASRSLSWISMVALLVLAKVSTPLHFAHVQTDNIVDILKESEVGRGPEPLAGSGLTVEVSPDSLEG
jgi:hypothetical protein